MFFSIIRKASFMLSLLGLTLACKPGPDPVAPPEPPKPGVPTAVGKPLGTVVSKTIGPAGGTLTSADGSMTLRFPAGALTKETIITAQPVENTAFGGAGVGYEFSPHGTQFKKPVTLSWTYKEEDLRGSSPQALGIAYQDEKGIWQGRDNLFVLAAQHRVVAPLYHFSRYSFYENFWLEPLEKTLAPNETVELKVFYQENHAENGGTGADVEPDTLLSDGHGGLEPVPLSTPVEILKADRVKNWRVNGQDVTDKVDSPTGFLSNHGNKSVIYKAPGQAPEANPVAVSVEVITPGKGKLILISNLTIESPNELTIEGTRQDKAYAIANITNGYLSITMTGKPYISGEKQPQVLIVLTDIPGPGSFNLSKENESKLAVAGFDTELTGYYWNYRPEPGKIVYGPGNVTISELNVANQTVAGSFSVTLHNYNPDTKKYKSLKATGKFRTGGQ